MSTVIEAEERDMLRDSLRRLLAETPAAKVPAALNDFGWTDLMAESPVEAVAALFSVQGQTVTATPAANAVMAKPLLAAAGLPAGGVGEWTIPLPPPGSVMTHPAALYVIGAGAPLGRCLVVNRHGDEPRLAALDVAATTARPVEGIDPDLGLVRLDSADSSSGDALARGDGGAASKDREGIDNVVVDSFPTSCAGGEAIAAWERAVAAGRVALAYELVALSGAMLALGVEHGRERRQFGQPIGRFQAVKHRLAEAKVVLAAAEAAIDEAAAAPGPLTALLAKLWAGRAARMAGKQVQQVLGGMGFTWEHPFHRHLRRALALDGLLGSAAELQHDLGRTLLATGEVPQLARLQ